MSPTDKEKLIGVLLRVGVFALIAFLGYVFIPMIFLLLLGDGVQFVVATLSTFATAAIANVVAFGIFERGQLADIGLGWSTASRRNLIMGIAGGVGAGVVVLGVPVALRVADVTRVPNQDFHWANLLFVSLLLLFGAVGEEMLFRGYAFQVLVHAIGPFATILPMAVLFGLAHSSQSEFHLAGAVEHLPVGRGFGLCVSAQRRFVAAHRPAFRLELYVAAIRGEPERVYNGSHGVSPSSGKLATSGVEALMALRVGCSQARLSWRSSFICERLRCNTKTRFCSRRRGHE